MLASIICAFTSCSKKESTDETKLNLLVKNYKLQKVDSSTNRGKLFNSVEDLAKYLESIPTSNQGATDAFTFSEEGENIAIPNARSASCCLPSNNYYHITTRLENGDRDIAVTIDYNTVGGKFSVTNVQINQIGRSADEFDSTNPPINSNCNNIALQFSTFHTKTVTITTPIETSYQDTVGYTWKVQFNPCLSGGVGATRYKINQLSR